VKRPKVQGGQLLEREREEVRGRKQAYLNRRQEAHNGKDAKSDAMTKKGNL